MKYTRGPWKAYVSTGYDIATIGKDRGEGRGFQKIAEVQTVNDEGDANALLISAAPELLEALKQNDAAMRFHPGGDNRSEDDIQATAAAIAKAEGIR